MMTDKRVMDIDEVKTLSRFERSIDVQRKLMGRDIRLDGALLSEQNDEWLIASGGV